MPAYAPRHRARDYVQVQHPPKLRAPGAKGRVVRRLAAGGLRDHPRAQLGLRIAHAALPISGKSGSDLRATRASRSWGRSSAQKEFLRIFARQGWVECDPCDIWSSQAGVTAEALPKANVKVSDVAAIGMTNQHETAVVWHRRIGVPIHNAIGWPDRRTTGMCDRLRARKLGEVVRRKVAATVTRTVVD